MTQTATVTANEIAVIKGVSVQAVHRQALRDAWEYDLSKTNQGRAKKHYFISELPENLKLKLNIQQAENTQNLLTVKSTSISKQITENKNNQAYVIPERARDIGLARYNLVHAFRAALKNAEWGKKSETEKAFLLSFNSGQLLPAIYNKVGKMSLATIRRLDKTLRDNNDDFHAIADQRGGWKKHGTTKWRKRQLSQGAQEAFLSCYLQAERPTIEMSIRATRMILDKQGVIENCSDITFRRWLKDYEKYNSHVITIAREGMKAYEDKWAPYITRDNSNIEVGQILVPDGHKLNFQILHPDTGKPCRMTLIVFQDWASRCPVGWQIMPTENTVAIMAAFRHSIITIGKIPACVYMDNGRAFKSKFFTETNPDFQELTGLYARLGTAFQFAKPYRGRSKPVERFFLTLNEQCERLIPSYTGASIADKPAWMHRNEKFHQDWHKAKSNGWIPTIREAAHLLDVYFNWYIRQPHEGLQGQRPLDVLEKGRGPGVDLVELNENFLWPVRKRANRCRVRLWGIDYEADCLHGMKNVIVKYDTANLEKVFCYTDDGNFIGEAFPVQALNPIAKLFGDQISVDQVKTALKRENRLKRETTENLKSLGVVQEDMETLDILPWRKKFTVIDCENSDNKKLIENNDTPELKREEKKRLELVLVKAEKEKNEPEKFPRPEFFNSDIERFDWIFQAGTKHKQALSAEDKAFKAYYIITDDYKGNYKQRYDDLSLLYAEYGDELMEGSR